MLAIDLRHALFVLLIFAAAAAHAEMPHFTFSQSVLDRATGRSMIVTGVCRPAAVVSSRTSYSAVAEILPEAATAVPLECGLTTEQVAISRENQTASVWNVGGTLVSVTPPPMAVYQAVKIKPVYVLECNDDGSYCETTYRCWEDPVELQSICEPL